MASSLIGALRVKFSAETAAFESGAKRVRQQAGLTARSMASAKSAASGFFAAFSVGILSVVAKRALDYAGSLGEVSQQLGVTTRDLQVFRFAAGQVGVSQEQLETGLSKLTITLGKVAAGAKEPAKAFAAIGISVDELKGKDTGQVLRMVADGLEKIPDRASRAAIEVALFGKTGSMLDNLLAGGRKAIDQLAAAADKLGMVLSDEQIQRADETADKLEAVKTVLAAQIAGVVADNATAIVSLASALAQLTAAVVKFMASNPQAALGIIGALLGGRVGGLPGAALGGIAGLAIGGRMAANARNSNMDIKFRKEQLAKARSLYGKYTKAGIANPAEASGLNREIKLANQAAAAAMRPKVAPAPLATGDIPQFLAGGGGKAKKDNSAKEAERAKLDALADAYQFDQEMRRSQADVLAAQRDLAIEVDDRARIELQMLDAERSAYKAHLDYEVAQYAITNGKQGMAKVQADQLLAAYDEADALHRIAIADEAAAQKKEEQERLIGVAFDLQRQALEAESRLAETSAERRDVELRLLDLAYQEERQRLERIIADKKLTQAVRDEAQLRLNAMPGQYALDRQGVMQSTRGPWEQWQADATNIGDKLEQLKVQGVGGLVDTLLAATEGWDNMKDVALNALKQIATELLRLQLMKFAANIFGGMGGMGGGADALTSGAGNLGALSFAGSILDVVPHGAMGLSGKFMGNMGTDRNLLSLNGVPIAAVNYGENFHIGNDNPSPRGGLSIHAPITIAADIPNPRSTGHQIASALKSEIARSAKRGG